MRFCVSFAADAARRDVWFGVRGLRLRLTHGYQRFCRSAAFKDWHLLRAAPFGLTHGYLRFCPYGTIYIFLAKYNVTAFSLSAFCFLLSAFLLSAFWFLVSRFSFLVSKLLRLDPGIFHDPFSGSRFVLGDFLILHRPAM